MWEYLFGRAIKLCTEKSFSLSGGISGAIVELLGAESRFGSFGSREQRLDDKRESQMGQKTLFLYALPCIRLQLYL